MKECNINYDEAGQQRKLQLQELEEIRNHAYENAMIYKAKSKAFHDGQFVNKHLKIGQKVLLFDSTIKLFAGKFRSKWVGPFVVVHVCSHCAVDIQSIDTGKIFKVNGQRLKPFYEGFVPRSVEVDYVCEPITTEHS